MMKPRADLTPNTEEFENQAFVKPTGFREYDARWKFSDEINLLGIQMLGLGLGTQIQEMGRPPKIVVGHDYRSYSGSIKQALTLGLMSAGIEVHDIGLALSPTTYFAQFALDVPACAMVTASHNPNGWTGVKMGVEPPLTHGPDEMARLKEIVLNGLGKMRAGGGYVAVEGMRDTYLDEVCNGHKIGRPLKVIAACGNGTAGTFAPEALRRIGCEVIERHAALDYDFPNYNPNPEDMGMLHDVRDQVLEHGADIGLCFDGDGDRCGVVDNTGDEIFADKMGLILARDLARVHDKPTFVVDVKSTGLFKTDPVMQKLGTTTDYWKTGHSYIKRRVNELDALVGFEKSGHFFFNKPIGRGYDCGLVTAVAIAELMDRNPGKSMSDLKDALPETWGSPTMSPHCADEEKYGVVDQVVAHFEAAGANGDSLMGQKIVDVNTVNGVRVMVEDGTWGLVRASSNTPNLVVVVESPASEINTKAMFEELNAVLTQHPQVGEYDQKL